MNSTTEICNFCQKITSNFQNYSDFIHDTFQNKDRDHFFSCSSCNSAIYCSLKCEKEDYEIHKFVCNKNFEERLLLLVNLLIDKYDFEVGNKVLNLSQIFKIKNGENTHSVSAFNNHTEEHHCLRCISCQCNIYGYNCCPKTTNYEDFEIKGCKCANCPDKEYYFGKIPNTAIPNYVYLQHHELCVLINAQNVKIKNLEAECVCLEFINKKLKKELHEEKTRFSATHKNYVKISKDYEELTKNYGLLNLKNDLIKKNVKI
jgi:hypothetical protein